MTALGHDIIRNKFHVGALECFARHDFTGALSLIEQAARKAPTDQTILRHYAEILLLDGRKNEARAVQIMLDKLQRAEAMQ